MPGRTGSRQQRRLRLPLDFIERPRASYGSIVGVRGQEMQALDGADHLVMLTEQEYVDRLRARTGLGSRACTCVNPELGTGLRIQSQPVEGQGQMNLIEPEPKKRRCANLDAGIEQDWIGT